MDVLLGHDGTLSLLPDVQAKLMQLLGDFSFLLIFIAAMLVLILGSLLFIAFRVK